MTIKVPPSRYLESYAGHKVVQVNRADLEDWDKALTARAGSVGRLRAWIRDYGSQKQPQFIADLEAVLSALTAPALGGEVLSALDEACANMSGSVDAILEHFSEHGKIIGDGEWRLREIFKHASEANAEFEKLVAKMIPPPAPTADARERKWQMRPADAPVIYRNGCNEPCDMDIGPCACGAWHDGTESQPLTAQVTRLEKLADAYSRYRDNPKVESLAEVDEAYAALAEVKGQGQGGTGQ